MVKANKPPTKAVRSQSSNSNNVVALKKSKKTTPEQLASIVNWLEVNANFKVITGAGAQGKKVSANAKVTKTAGYKDLSLHINTMHKTDWTPKMAEKI